MDTKHAFISEIFQIVFVVRQTVWLTRLEFFKSKVVKWLMSYWPKTCQSKICHGQYCHSKCNPATTVNISLLVKSCKRDPVYASWILNVPFLFLLLHWSCFRKIPFQSHVPGVFHADRRWLVSHHINTGCDKAMVRSMYRRLLLPFVKASASACGIMANFRERTWN